MDPEPSADSLQPDWSWPMCDAQAFAREQDSLAGTWTFLCLASDVQNDGDWIVTSLALRSVFVQRFGNTLRGFENRCAHRGFPLRTQERGNGVILCGFHHWRYNQDGLALGIPACQEAFGTTPRELNARLQSLEIETCGNLVFGRFPGRGSDATLRSFLGETYDILAAFSQYRQRPWLMSCDVKANWRLCIEITMDDYHLAAVHPDTFGRQGYLARENLRYFECGDHSAHFAIADSDALQSLAEACRDGTAQSKNYLIFNLFPGLSLLLRRSATGLSGTSSARSPARTTGSARDFNPRPPNLSRRRASAASKSASDGSRGSTQGSCGSPARL
jgi:phenylpropionate dioxygenase-like ring-hydroxylating dioxygenase large terminal subunit